MDQKDMIAFFFNLKNKYNYNEEEIYDMLHTYDIGKLDISRIYRYLNKYLGIESLESLSSSIKLNNDNDDNDKNENNAHGSLISPSDAT
jgi:hypothetical protein